MDMSPLLDESLLADQRELQAKRAQLRKLMESVKELSPIIHEKEKAAWTKILRTADLDNIEDLLIVSKAMEGSASGGYVCETALTKWVKKRSPLLAIDGVWRGNSEETEEPTNPLPQLEVGLRKDTTREEKKALRFAILHFHELFSPLNNDYSFTLLEKSYGKHGSYAMKLEDDASSVTIFKGHKEIFVGSLKDAINFCCKKVYH